MILYDKSKSYDNYCEFTTDVPHKDFSCIISNITDNTQYIVSISIKIKDENAKENYLYKYIEIVTKESKKNKKTNNSIIYYFFNYIYFNRNNSNNILYL